jgi:tetratricopeptide (TPR) repeat protein
MPTRRAAFLLAAWAFTASAAVAQPDAAGLLRAMQDAYARLDYATAEERAREALAAYDAFSPDQLVRVHTTLGLILYARNEPLEAEGQFAAALSLDPALTLDPVLVSPKTLEFFDAVRARRGADEPEGREPTVRYVRVPDPRPAATLRSLAVPGWGQLHKGERTKGWVLVGAWGALGGGTVAAHVLRAGARQDYLDAAEPDEIAARYATYDAWHRTRGALALGTVAVWAYAVLDALVLQGQGGGGAFSWGPVGLGEGVGVRLHVAF